MQKLTHANFQFLENESRDWVRANIITEEIRDVILVRYEVHSRAESLQRTGLLTILSLGVFLLGLAIFLLVSFNWAAMTAVQKLSIVFGALAVAYITGGIFGARKHPVLSEVAFFFGAILFGVGIWQIGQIFHISAHAPDLLWYWAVGSLALAIGLRTPVVHALVCVLLMIWIPWEILGYYYLAPGFLRLFGGDLGPERAQRRLVGAGPARAGVLGHAVPGSRKPKPGDGPVFLRARVPLVGPLDSGRLGRTFWNLVLLRGLRNDPDALAAAPFPGPRIRKTLACLAAFRGGRDADVRRGADPVFIQ